jgi:S1-C subfamily serine protease
VNGITANSVDDAQRGIYGAQVGDVLRLELERDGRPVDVKVTLGEAPHGSDR